MVVQTRLSPARLGTPPYRHPSASLRVQVSTYQDKRPEMKGERGERWQALCSQAAQEQGPDRLMELIRKMNELLDEKEERLKRENHRKRPRSRRMNFQTVSRVTHATFPVW
jgi:putative protein kinase ArgK-like GTPase of G3E family